MLPWPFVPAALVRAVAAPLAWVAVRRGHDAPYWRERKAARARRASRDRDRAAGPGATALGPAVHRAQLTLIAVSSMTNEVCSV